PFRQGGGIDEFLWKGEGSNSIANIDIILNYPYPEKYGKNLHYKLSLTSVGQRLELVDEAVENAQSYEGQEDVYFYYRYQKGNPVLNINNQEKRYLRREDLISDQSVLSQRKDPDVYPELSYLSTQFSKVGLYRHWQMGRYSEPRNAQKADLPLHPLLEDGSNLGLVLKALQRKLGQRKLIEYLEKFYEEAEELDVSIYGGTVQIFIREKG
ncbi:MAG: AAA family ATPase, partial [Dolichospermum sp.]